MLGKPAISFADNQENTSRSVSMDPIVRDNKKHIRSAQKKMSEPTFVIERTTIDLCEENREKGNNDGTNDDIDKETIIFSFVKLFRQMMNRRHIFMSTISAILGVYCLYIGHFRNTDSFNYGAKHTNAYSLMTFLIIYGSMQLTLAVIFAATYSATKISIRHGRKSGLFIFFALMAALAYLFMLLVTIITEFIGLSKVIQLYARIDYEDQSNLNYIDPVLYQSAAYVFVSHISLLILACCCRCQ